MPLLSPERCDDWGKKLRTCQRKFVIVVFSLGEDSITVGLHLQRCVILTDENFGQSHRRKYALCEEMAPCDVVELKAIPGHSIS